MINTIQHFASIMMYYFGAFVPILSVIMVIALVIIVALCISIGDRIDELRKIKTMIYLMLRENKK